MIYATIQKSRSPVIHVWFARPKTTPEPMCGACVAEYRRRGEP